MKAAVVNLPASVRQRLLNLATERKEDFGLILSRYGLERFLYRLSVSPHRDSFVLKGALLLQIWTGETYRPTRDLAARNGNAESELPEDLCRCVLTIIRKRKSPMQSS
jgi:Nucleotidyl transferase AbiEii toxin, Type IV TA system